VLDVTTNGIVTTGCLTEVVYELIDAHSDTMALAEWLSEDPRWGAHLEYLRGLQRVGREALARMPDASA
jgi:hypothetical protein